MCCPCVWLQQDPAGWSGWFEVPPQQQDTVAAAAGAQQRQQQHQGDGSAEGSPGRHTAATAGEQAGSEQQHSDGSAELEDALQDAELSEGEQQSEEELDEEELMQQLGVQLEQQLQEVERQGLPADVLARWVAHDPCSLSPIGPSHPQVCWCQHSAHALMMGRPAKAPSWILAASARKQTPHYSGVTQPYVQPARC